MLRLTLYLLSTAVCRYEVIGSDSVNQGFVYFSGDFFVVTRENDFEV